MSPRASRSRISPQELLRRAAKVRLVLLDVDGVLTDGRIWYGPEGEAMKAFDVRDGQDWKEIARATTVGWKKLLRFPAVETAGVRVRVLRSRGEVSPLTPDRFGLYLDPGR